MPTPSLEKSEDFKDTYRTEDGLCQFEFIGKRFAGDKVWQFSVRYGDARMTSDPTKFFNPGILIHEGNADHVRAKLAAWADIMWAKFGFTAGGENGLFIKVPDPVNRPADTPYTLGD